MLWQRGSRFHRRVIFRLLDGADPQHQGGYARPLKFPANVIGTILL
jgi:hypothetical protein